MTAGQDEGFEMGRLIINVSGSHCKGKWEKISGDARISTIITFFGRMYYRSSKGKFERL